MSIDVQLPSYSVKALVNFLTRSGVSRDILLSQLCCDEETLNDCERLFSLSTYESLFTLANQQLSVPNSGFQYGKSFDFSCWGLLGHIVMSAKNLADALKLQHKYQCLYGNIGQAYYQQEESAITMRWLANNACSENAIEHVITAWVAFAFSVIPYDEAPVSIHFTHECLTNVEEYQAFFGCPVYFNAQFNGVIIKPESLNLYSCGYNKDVLNVLCCHADNLLAAKRHSASSDIVAQYIIEVLPDHVPSLHEVAEHLGISTRQLQRTFSKEKTNLTALLESIRHELAIAYLTQTDHKLLYISTMLGYSEQSAFQRAFKRWQHVTPQAFRLKPTTS